MFGISLGLGGSKSQGTSSSVTDTKSTTTLEGTTSTNIQRLDDNMQAILDAFTSQAFDDLGEDSEYTRENAIADAQGTVNAIFRQFSEQALPEIFQAQGNTGAYNTSAGQMLANDAYGQAVASSAQVVMDNIATYAGLGQQERQTQLSALLNAFGVQVQAGEQQTTETDQTSTTDMESTTSGRQSGSSFGGSLGASFGF